MKIRNYLLNLLVSTTLLFACSTSGDEDPQPEIKPDPEQEEKEEDEDNNSENFPLFMLDSACVIEGQLEEESTQISLSMDSEKLYLIEGIQQMVKIEPDTNLIKGFYIQIQGNDEFQCTSYQNGFINIGAQNQSIFNATFCAYDESGDILGCLDIPVEVEEKIEVIFCVNDIAEKTWEWKYTLFNDNLFNYPKYDGNEPSTITGYCQTSEGTIENDLLLEEEGWINYIHLIMKDENKSFKWIMDSYTKHWDILTTDCNQVGYETDTIKQEFTGSYSYQATNETLTLNFDTSHPESGTHDIILSCNLMIITRKSGFGEGGGGEIINVFEKLEE